MVYGIYTVGHKTNFYGSQYISTLYSSVLLIFKPQKGLKLHLVAAYITLPAFQVSKAEAVFSCEFLVLSHATGIDVTRCPTGHFHKLSLCGR